MVSYTVNKDMGSLLFFFIVTNNGHLLGEMASRLLTQTSESYGHCQLGVRTSRQSDTLLTLAQTRLSFSTEKIESIHKLLPQM